jgi:hypothetical protein
MKCPTCGWDAPLWKHAACDTSMCADCLVEQLAKHYAELAMVSQGWRDKVEVRKRA